MKKMFVLVSLSLLCAGALHASSALKKSDIIKDFYIVRPTVVCTKGLSKAEVLCALWCSHQDCNTWSHMGCKPKRPTLVEAENLLAKQTKDKDGLVDEFDGCLMGVSFLKNRPDYIEVKGYNGTHAHTKNAGQVAIANALKEKEQKNKK